MKDYFITDIFIKKVRHLKDIKIPLSPTERKHLIFTGKNGSGKTSVLESLKHYFTIIEDEELVANQIDIYNLYKKNQTEAMEQLQIENARKFYNASMIHIKGEKHNFPEIYEQYKSGNFLTVYFPAKRKPIFEKIETIEKISLDDKYSIDQVVSGKFLKYIMSLKADSSFAREDNDMEMVKKIETWFDNLQKALRELFEDDTLILEFERKDYNFNIITRGREPFDFNSLSDGYSAILEIITELILRMEKKRQKSYDVQGVVFIDEVETHLHVSLQKKILPILIKLFPRIQFIVTTHSPFILSSIDNAVIYDLENMIQVEDLSTYTYESIIENYFDVDQYSMRIKEKTARYEALVHLENPGIEEQLEIEELEKYLEAIPRSIAPELVFKYRSLLLKKGNV